MLLQKLKKATRESPAASLFLAGSNAQT